MSADWFSLLGALLWGALGGLWYATWVNHRRHVRTVAEVLDREPDNNAHRKIPAAAARAARRYLNPVEPLRLTGQPKVELRVLYSPVDGQPDRDRGRDVQVDGVTVVRGDVDPLAELGPVAVGRGEDPRLQVDDVDVVGQFPALAGEVQMHSHSDSSSFRVRVLDTPDATDRTVDDTTDAGGVDSSTPASADSPVGGDTFPASSPTVARCDVCGRRG